MSESEGQSRVLTEEQKAMLDQVNWADVVQYVHENARARHYQGNLPRLEDEINFLMGAGAVLFALGMERRFPSSWVFGVMAGKSPSGIKYRVQKPRRQED